MTTTSARLPQPLPAKGGTGTDSLDILLRAAAAATHGTEGGTAAPVHSLHKDGTAAALLFLQEQQRQQCSQDAAAVAAPVPPPRPQPPAAAPQQPHLTAATAVTGATQQQHQAAIGERHLCLVPH